MPFAGAGESTAHTGGMRLLPGANQEQISTFKEYIERQVAANRDFGEKLLRAKDSQEALGIQVEHFQSQFDGGSRGGNSDRRMDSWPGEFTQAFFG
jgi:hypothetical protein